MNVEHLQESQARRDMLRGGFVMEGRWAVEFEERLGGGLTASLVKGPVSSAPYNHGDRIELVPCDDAAIERVGLREKVADALAHNDACGSGPVSRGEYLADADALISLVLSSLVAGETP